VVERGEQLSETNGKTGRDCWSMSAKSERSNATRVARETGEEGAAKGRRNVIKLVKHKKKREMEGHSRAESRGAHYRKGKKSHAKG